MRKDKCQYTLQRTRLSSLAMSVTSLLGYQMSSFKKFNLANGATTLQFAFMIGSKQIAYELPLFPNLPLISIFM